MHIINKTANSLFILLLKAYVKEVNYLTISAKTNKLEMKKRLLYISELLLEGKSTKEICRFASEKWYISRRQVERYITSSYINWQKEFENKGEAILEYNITLRMNLYNKSYDEGKYRTCLTILKDIAKIEGLYNNI